MGRATKPPKAKPPEPTEIVVTYDLFDLPTAFHKAGLAGLVLLIESLKARQVLTADEAKYDLSATSATVTFTEPLVRKLMDDVYDAEPKLIAVKSKWPGAEVVREPTAEEREAGTPFVYRVVQPKGQFLRDYYPEMPEGKSWLKLWRDMLWNIPRGRPTTREPYNQRAEGESCKEGPDAWGDLLKVHKARTKNSFHTTELSSALFPGAQAVNAEGVPFEGRAEQNLLLHFWPLTVLLFVPQGVEVDGETDFVGYTLAVPDVANLTEFVRDYPKLLASLSKDARGYRPAQAVIDLPAEGALAFLDDLAILTGLQVETRELRFSIGGVEYLHLHKPPKQNNVKLMATGRVSPNRRLLTGYRAIASPSDESTRYRNPLFRRGLLVALLDGLEWYQPFGRTFSTFDEGVFLRQPRKPGAEDKGPPQFASDAAKKFRHVIKLFTDSLERLSTMSEAHRDPAPLPVLVEQLIRTYLLGKAKAKCNLDVRAKMKSLTDSQRKDVYEKKRLVAKEAFLAARSRRDADFVSYFSSVICSAGTYFDRKSPDFQAFATALIDPTQTDTIKTLTLLALSANS